MADKAFIFDLDGVIIDSETWWDKLYFHQAGHSLGQTVKSAYQEAKIKKPDLTWKEYFSDIDQKATIIYNQAPLTPNLNQLLNYLIKKQYWIGLVSGSPQKWINYVLKRLDYPIETSLSLEDRSDLKPKPAPDGYREIINKFQVSPENTLILEDTDMGIKSAKAADATAICLTTFHPKNYHPTGADIYVKDIQNLLVYLDSIQG